MNITDTPDTDSIPAAQSVNRLFAQIAPAAAETVAPFVERLFAALSHGNTFIYISQAEADALAQAAPLVGSDASSPVVLHGRRLFIAKYWHLEKQLAAEIQRLSAHTPRQPEKPLAELLANWFADDTSRDQRAAAALALLKNFVLIRAGYRQNHHRCQAARPAAPPACAAHRPCRAHGQSRCPPNRIAAPRQRRHPRFGCRGATLPRQPHRANRAPPAGLKAAANAA